MHSSNIAVLIVGAGPVGLTLACELSRHGVPCRIVDQADGPSLYSKAQIVHARTLEIFEALGLAEEAIARGRKAHGFSVYAPSGERVAHLVLEGIASHYDFLLNLSQRDTELLLAEHLTRQGVRIERGVTLEDFTQDDDGVTAALVRADGTREEVRCAYLAGCDGAKSTVRKVLDLSLEGSTYVQRIIQADVRVEFPGPMPDDEVIAYLSPEGPVGFFPLPEPHRYRMLVILLEGQDLEPTLENFQAVLRARGPAGAVVSDPAWMVAFRFHCRMVRRYRVGRAFLLGDAAHVHSPAGGQGMNMGIQDAFNLGWKLALSLLGAALPAVLDSYDTERRPIAARTLEGTDAATQGGFAVMTVQNPLVRSLRDQLLGFVTGLSFVQRTAARTLSMIEVSYRDSPLVAQHRTSLLKAHVTAHDTEEPGLGDWMAFGDGPAPGDRAFDAPVRDGDAATSLFALMYRGGHTLLLFDGVATEAGYHNLAAIARRTTERLGDLVDVYVIVPGTTRPAALDWDRVLFDPDGAAHRRYGARVECLYFIRPDGHVGYRSQPAATTQFAVYLDRVFAQSPAEAR